MVGRLEVNCLTKLVYCRRAKQAGRILHVPAWRMILNMNLATHLVLDLQGYFDRTFTLIKSVELAHRAWSTVCFSNKTTSTLRDICLIPKSLSCREGPQDPRWSGSSSSDVALRYLSFRYITLWYIRSLHCRRKSYEYQYTSQNCEHNPWAKESTLGQGQKQSLSFDLRYKERCVTYIRWQYDEFDRKGFTGRSIIWWWWP